MRKSKYAQSLFPQRAVDGVRTAENASQNGLPRANRNGVNSLGVWATERTLRQKSQHIKGMQKRAHERQAGWHRRIYCPVPA